MLVTNLLSAKYNMQFSQVNICKYHIQDDWLVVSTPLKNMKVSWDQYSQYMESQKIHVPNHQPDENSRNR
jgi:hypothetical protein